MNTGTGLSSSSLLSRVADAASDVPSPVSPPSLALASSLALLASRAIPAATPALPGSMVPRLSPKSGNSCPINRGTRYVKNPRVTQPNCSDVTVLSNEEEDKPVPVFMVCGPPGTGKTTLVRRLIESDPRFVEPTPIDRIKEGMTFERLTRRNEILSVLDGEGGRYGLTKDCILRAAEDATALASTDVDANVDANDNVP